jgi:O-antigen polymerase
MREPVFPKSFLLTVIAVFVPALALITLPIYGAASLSAYYFLQFSVALLLFVLGVGIFFGKVTLTINRLPLPVLFLWGWLLFMLLQRLLTETTVILRLELCIGLSLFFLLTWLLFENKLVVAEALLTLLTTTACLQSLVCIAQGAGLLGSFNSFFPVTGTWVNPNVTAMYLAMSIPVVLYMISYLPGKKYRCFGWITLLFLITALVLLKCRTAFIGAFVIACYFLWYNRRIASYITVLKKLPRWSMAVIIFLACAGMLVALVSAKSKSSFGRVLIWKISASMMGERLFTGYGTGMFEKEYNIRQAGYFSGNNGTGYEKEVAAFVNMPYNEYLEQGIEGGIPKLLLWIAFLVSLFFTSKVVIAEHYLLIMARAGILGFAVMGLFNFVLTALPAACMFILFAGIIAAQANTSSLSFRAIKMRGFRPAAALIFIAGVCCVYYITHEMKACRINRKAAALVKKQQYIQALSLLNAKNVVLPQSDLYALNKAAAFKGLGNSDSAIIVLQHTAQYSSHPVLLTQLGRAYSDARRFTEAEQIFNQLHFMEPGRLSPLYELMLLYNLWGRPKESEAAAKMILQQKTAINNIRTEKIKKEAALSLSRTLNPR